MSEIRELTLNEIDEVAGGPVPVVAVGAARTDDCTTTTTTTTEGNTTTTTSTMTCS